MRRAAGIYSGIKWHFILTARFEIFTSKYTNSHCVPQFCSCATQLQRESCSNARAKNIVSVNADTCCCFCYTPLHRYTPLNIRFGEPSKQLPICFYIRFFPANRFSDSHAHESVQSPFDFGGECHFTRVYACTMNCQLTIHALIAAIKVRASLDAKMHIYRCSSRQ